MLGGNLEGKCASLSTAWSGNRFYLQRIYAFFLFLLLLLVVVMVNPLVFNK